MVRYSSLNNTPLVPLLLFLGIAITAAFVLIAGRYVVEYQSDVANSQSTLIKDSVTRKINATGELIHGMRTLFDASNNVDSDEFRLISEDVLARHPYVTSSLYLPIISAENRDSFEVRMRDKGYINFSINERDKQRFLSAKNRSRYSPVIYVEPLNPANASLIGFDFLSDASYNIAIFKAIDTAQAVAALSSQRGDLNHYTVFKAIYAGKDTPDLVSERRQTVNGIIALHIKPTKLFEENLLGENISVSLMMKSVADAGGEITVHSMSAPLHATDDWLATDFEKKYDIDSEAQNFVLVITKSLHWQDTNYWMVLIALIVGLFLTTLLVLLARTITLRAVDLQRRNTEIQEVVASRTRELAFEKERAQVTLESIGDAVVTTDEHGCIEYLNPIAERIAGGKIESVKKAPITTIFNLVHEETKAPVVNPVLMCIEEEKLVSLKEQSSLINNNGEAFSIECSAAPIRDKDGVITGSVMVIHDVSQARKMADQMTYQATHDALTGLPNRVLLMDRLTQGLTRAPWNKKIIGVLFFDLDRFKLVNDTLGHDVGDELLRQVAERIKQCLREGDTVSRLGGDEFVVILTDIAHEGDVEEIAEKIIKVLEAPFAVGKDEFFTSASIGVSLFPKNGHTALTLMKKADTAMYRAKASGRNNYVFYSDEMSEHGAKRLNVENDLRRALERNEFELFYQPQVSSFSGKITGAEALIRWNHPQKGMVPPIEFIPVAEETGLIVQIGQWVIDEACRQNKAWQDKGLPKISVAVNIAGRQFQRGSLLKNVQDALDQSGLAPEHLELELTEGILAKDSHAASTILDKLKEMGIKLSIDDFGTGYSSLSYLKRFPLSTLKVDRCFVKDITTDPDDAAICAAVIAMAHNLNLTVIAEGVEDAEQLTFLQEHKCDCIQGYLFSKPLPAQEFEEFIKTAQTEDQNIIWASSDFS